MSETQEVVVTEDVVVTQEIVETDDDDIDIEQLIMLVEERRLLWDKSLDEYKDKNKNREAWREICQALFPGFEEKSAPEKKTLGKLPYRGFW